MVRPTPGLSYVAEDTDVRVVGHERLEDVYRTQADRLWRALVLHTADRERAADAVSEAFAQALRRGEAIRDPVHWVWKTAFLIADRLAAEDRSTRGVPIFTDDEAATELLDLIRALRHLTPHQRASIVLHYYGGYSLREVHRLHPSRRRRPPVPGTRPPTQGVGSQRWMI
jgi:DNA-directed RNA polymerase specialized sigma24 family protein